MKKYIIFLIIFLCGLFMGNAQSVLEFAAGAGNPTGNGPTVSNQTITFQKNTDNPTANSFATYTPTTTATFSLTNQQRTMTVSPFNGAMFGGTSPATPAISVTSSSIFPLMNAIGGAANNQFTSSNSSAGTGISVTANSVVEIFATTHPLQETGAALPAAGSNVRYQYADLVVTFNNPITNPIFHFAGCGANTRGAAGNNFLLSAELELMTAGTTLTRLSGSTEFTVPTTTTIINGATQFSPTTGAGAMSGSVQVNGNNLTTVTFRIFLKAQDNTSISGAPSTWDDGGYLSGDAFTVGVSASICNAGTTAPPLSAATATVCTPNTVNLNSYHTGTIPSGTALVWFNNNAHTGTAYPTLLQG